MSPVSMTVLRDARRLERGDGFAANGAFPTSEMTMWPAYSPFDRHMDDGADAVAAACHAIAQLLHQLAVAGGDGHAVHHRGHAVAADAPECPSRGCGRSHLPVGLLQALADGMRGGALGQRRVFEQLFLRHRAVMHGADLKHALRQRAGLVEYDGLRSGTAPRGSWSP